LDKKDLIAIDSKGLKKKIKNSKIIIKKNLKVKFKTWEEDLNANFGNFGLKMKK
jgi:hypothetical protein